MEICHWQMNEVKPVTQKVFEEPHPMRRARHFSPFDGHFWAKFKSLGKASKLKKGGPPYSTFTNKWGGFIIVRFPDPPPRGSGSLTSFIIALRIILRVKSKC